MEPGAHQATPVSQTYPDTRKEVRNDLDSPRDRNPGSARKIEAKRGPRGKAAPVPSNRDQVHAMREWAKSAGFEVSTRGRISKAIQEAFAAAH